MLRITVETAIFKVFWEKMPVLDRISAKIMKID